MHDYVAVPPAAALDRLTREHDLDHRAAENLLQYLHDQKAAAGAVPDAATVVVERVRDELGDWRVCVLSPRGGRIHAPWAMAAAAKIREGNRGRRRDVVGRRWVRRARFPDVDEPPDPRLLLPGPEEVQALVDSTARRDCSIRGKVSRKRGEIAVVAEAPARNAGTTLAAAKTRSRFAGGRLPFRIVPSLTRDVRECLRDYFDMPALVQTLTDVRSRTLRIATVDSKRRRLSPRRCSSAMSRALYDW